MAYYNYYQNSQPSWGTQQYQSVPPPIPQYQPQPSWHGGDYYRAHAESSENTLFDYAWSKVRNLVGGTSAGKSEAHHWWKRVYGGLVSPAKLLPRELGAAAGYEAFRCWEHHKAIYVQPLSDDQEREREGLIGIAAAEATKLWAYTQRPRDKYGRMEASEVAAATASRLFNRSYDHKSPYESYERHSRSRRRSISGTRYASRSNSFYDDTGVIVDTRNDYLDAYPVRGRSRSRSRHSYGRSSSRYHSPSPVSFSRRSVSPVVYGGSPVGMSSAAITFPSAYDPGLGPGIPGTYYPNASSPYYDSSSTGYTYQQAPTTYAAAGSPYAYAGSSVGLPPPPAGQYLGAPETYRHHRTRSAGAYGATRPSFGY